MNYRFLFAWVLMASMYTSVKANPPKEGDQSKVVPSGLKIGYVDVAYIFGQLPEAIKNGEEFQTFQEQLKNQIQLKGSELERKISDYQKQVDTFTEVQQKQKQAELNALHQSFRALEQQMPAEIEKKYKAVIQPIHHKIKQVIDKIAKEQSYAFVLAKDTEAGPIVLFAQPALDLSGLVLEQLKAMAPKEMEPPVVGPKAQTPAQPSTRSAKTVKKK
ncbi:OmpH family outer membrane protein [Candidatus Cardinium hertigii]|uniref:OmpH family outer membrane protein n=1 Tax=Candidatus Cardinium hertigii TaxID=247481 RepID=UPI003D7E06C1